MGGVHRQAGREPVPAVLRGRRALDDASRGAPAVVFTTSGSGLVGTPSARPSGPAIDPTRSG